ncbi:phosphodiester glycosidase family protein [Thioalkalicoccus limnaeus]|uniref:Phosphodiester glycosidase family protein n=1 Tax=Thioalkalicoccus limnaeus TaxID=120681 RepID=A0ABV4BAG7_9GAMM
MIRTLFYALVVVALATVTGNVTGDWKAAAEIDRFAISPELTYAQRTAMHANDGKQVTVHLAFFTSRAFRLEVIDLDADSRPALPGLSEAFRAAGSVAGVNGGFFHADRQPLGLMISEGQRIHRFERSRLLSGVIYSDQRGIHLVRRAQFRDHPGITALLQSGPYLVEHGQAVRGLSASDPRPRTFVATDWRGHWVLGATPTPISLADLAAVLATPGALTDWTVDRALNLDGGSSTGFFFDRGPDQSPVTITPIRRVRNLLGVRPR